MGSEKGGGMNAEQIKAAAERYQNPYPRASESGGIEYCSPWVHKQEWEDLHALANAMCERIAADAIQRTQHCPICEARSKADEAERAERERIMRDCFATAVSGGGEKPYVKIVCQSFDHLHETYRLVLGIKPTN